jgi:hypothetical protein
MPSDNLSVHRCSINTTAYARLTVIVAYIVQYTGINKFNSLTVSAV